MVDTSFPVQRLLGSQPAPSAPAQRSRLDGLLLLLFLTGMGALLIRGWQFYALSVGERVDHPDFRVLGPSGSLGQGYGTAGTALIFTNLLYLVRRRFARLSVGSLRTWLDVHAFTGLFGGMLVVFHSAFQARSTISLLTLGTASLFSLVSSARLHRIDPEEYLRCLIWLVPLWPAERMLELSPLFWNQTRARLDGKALAAELSPIQTPVAPLDTSRCSPQRKPPVRRTWAG